MAHSLVVVGKMVRAARPSPAADSPRIATSSGAKGSRREEAQFLERVGSSPRRCLPTTHEIDEPNVCHRTIVGEIVKYESVTQGGLYHFTCAGVRFKGRRISSASLSHSAAISR